MAAGSVHVAGDMVQEGSELAIDMAVSDEAANGTITVKGATIELLSADGSFYMKSDQEGWDTLTGQPGMGELFGDKYLLVPPDDSSFDSFESLTDFDAFVDEVLSADGKVTKGEESDLDGTAVISLVDKKDEGKMYIATTGDPVPVQIDGPKDAGAVTFEWGAEVDAQAPAEDDIVDMSQFS